jgi:hypothetical protein
MPVLSSQFVYPEPGKEANTPYERAYHLHGKGVDAIFGGSPERTHTSSTGESLVIPATEPSMLAPTPWPRAMRTKSDPLFDQAAVTSVLRQPPHLEEFDPRMLHSSQPNVTLEGARYYDTPEYFRTGETFADQGNAGNRYPVVYESENTGRRILLSGHHRATVALGNAVPLLARRVTGR